MIEFEGWTSGPEGRGSLDIIFSCLSALFLCSWSAICVNVPAPGTTYIGRQLHKVQLTVITLLGSEFTLVVAMGQWHAARNTLKEFRRNDWAPWTLRHSFCAEMGFWVAATRDDVPVRFPLNGKALLYLMKAGHISEQERKEKILIEESSINDLNKFDSLARILAAGQAGWLVVNSIGRWAQGLPITTLELTVLGFFVPNLGILYFWARKPSDIESTVILRLNTTVVGLKEEAVRNGYMGATREWYETPVDFISRQEWHGSLIYSYWLNTPLLRKLRRVVFGPKIETRPISSIPDMSLPPLPLRLEFIEAAFAVVFLGMNFIAWNWHFPTHAERILWRVAASAMTFTFGFGCVAHFAASVLRPHGHAQMEMSRQRNLNDRLQDEKYDLDQQKVTVWNRLKRWRLKWTVRLRNNSPTDDPNLDMPLRILLPGLPLMTLYVMCRVAIFVEDGLAFRAQPPGTYETVRWTDFLPHIN